MNIIKRCECGGLADIHTWEIEEDDEGQYTFDMYYIECERCHKRNLVLELTEEDAVQLWNRTYADIPKKKLEEEVI